MDQARILLGETSTGVLADVFALLRQGGYICVYTQEEAEVAKHLAEHGVDVVLASGDLAGKVLRLLTDQESGIHGSTIGYMIDLPGPGSPDDPLYLRRSIVQRLGKDDSAEAIADSVRSAIPRLLVLRQAREASRYLRAVADAVRTARNSGADSPAGGGLPALDTIVRAADMKSPLEHVTFFMQPDASDVRCNFQRCGNYLEMARSIRDAIEVLRATKNQFKSKELGELRKRLESTLDASIFSTGGPTVPVGDRKPPL